MKISAASSNLALLSAVGHDERAQTGPSFAAALCGFLSTTVATTMLMFLLSSV